MTRRYIAKAALLAVAIACGPGCSRSRQPAVPRTDDLHPVEQAPEQSEGPLDVTFEQLHLDLPPDSVYQRWMLPLRIENLAGRRIRLRGFMCAAIFQLHNIAEFPLMREKECPYGPGGQAHHVAEVKLKRGTTINFTTDEICIEGVFSIDPYTGSNGKTWSLYRLDEATLCR